MKPIVLAALVVFAGANASAARTWTVGAVGADFPLIAPALAAAADGDVIRVGRGVYREALVVDKRVAIVGDGLPLVVGLGFGSVIRVLAAGVEIRGLAIEGSGAGDTNEMDAAIEVAAGNTRILGNRMRRVFYGVVVAGASGVEIRDNDITGFVDLPFGKRGDGVYVYRARGSRVVRNRITGQRDGIYFQYSPDGIAEGNVVDASRYGLHVMFANDIVIRDNTFTRSSVGGNIMDSRAIVVEGNRFQRNRGTSAVGLALKGCDGSTVSGNIFIDNARGLQVDASNLNHFRGNRLSYNDAAVMLFSSAERNTFSSNVFEGNWTDVMIAGSGASTHWSQDGRGNTWSGYQGFDFDGDGIGEAPHALLTPFAAIESANPAARLFLQSPAAAGLALAARAGLAPGSTEQDPDPVVAAASTGAVGTSELLAALAMLGVFGTVLVLRIPGVSHHA